MLQDSISILYILLELKIFNWYSSCFNNVFPNWEGYCRIVVSVSLALVDIPWRYSSCIQKGIYSVWQKALLFLFSEFIRGFLLFLLLSICRFPCHVDALWVYFVYMLHVLLWLASSFCHSLYFSWREFTFSTSRQTFCCPTSLLVCFLEGGSFLLSVLIFLISFKSFFFFWHALSSKSSISLRVVPLMDQKNSSSSHHFSIEFDFSTCLYFLWHLITLLILHILLELYIDRDDDAFLNPFFYFLFSVFYSKSRYLFRHSFFSCFSFLTSFPSTTMLFIGTFLLSLVYSCS